MATDAVSAAATVTGAKIDAGRKTLASSYETFLALLTTQLKNQDPTAPLDTNTFTQQLVQMSGVEQQLLTNDILKGLSEKAGGDGMTNAVGYIGRTITAETPDAALKGGKADWTYTLAQGAASVNLEIYDSSGRVVRRLEGEEAAGDHAFSWDGKDALGNQLSDGGVYSLRVVARDADGKGVANAVTTQGVVNAVESWDGVTVLIVNGAAVPLDAVTAVRQSA